MSKTSQLRDFATSSSRIFGWDKKTGPQTEYNKVLITQEWLEQARDRCDAMTEEEKKELERRQATPEGQEELRKMHRELVARAQNTEPLKLPPA